jgi:hypothetical protein
MLYYFPVAILHTFFTSITNQKFGQVGCSLRCDVIVDNSIYSRRFIFNTTCFGLHGHHQLLQNH